MFGYIWLHQENVKSYVGHKSINIKVVWMVASGITFIVWSRFQDSTSYIPHNLLLFPTFCLFTKAFVVFKLQRLLIRCATSIALRVVTNFFPISIICLCYLIFFFNFSYDNCWRTFPLKIPFQLVF